MKPIEPGCLAITVGAILKENIGKVVTVVRKKGDVWRIQGDIVTVGGQVREGVTREM